MLEKCTKNVVIGVACTGKSPLPPSLMHFNCLTNKQRLLHVVGLLESICINQVLCIWYAQRMLLLELLVLENRLCHQVFHFNCLTNKQRLLHVVGLLESICINQVLCIWYVLKMYKECYHWHCWYWKVTFAIKYCINEIYKNCYWRCWYLKVAFTTRSRFCLRGYCTSNQKLACFVLSKLSTFFWKIICTS